LEMGSRELFSQAGSWPMILLISASQVARIIDVSHRHQVQELTLSRYFTQSQLHSLKVYNLMSFD
jgi:hypothetical protein